MVEHAISHYAHELRQSLPKQTFAPRPSRLLWLIPHAAIIIAGIWLLAHGVPWYADLLLAVVIGHSYACTGFVAHETLHGSTVRNSTLKKLVGWVAFLPFLFSPTFWIGWHNKIHHANTARPGHDPDNYPSLAEYRSSKQLRVINHITPGVGHRFGWLTLILGLFAQGTALLLGCRRLLGFTKAEQRRSLLESGASVLFWTALAIWIGGVAFIFAYVLPLLVANTVLTSYILTNHQLSPLTETNDPLLNSLTVTTPPILATLHLNFGLHVEHHLFPSMNPHYAPLVQRELRSRWPERYQALPFLVAMRRIFATSRVYKDANTLIDPASGQEFDTLAPRVLGATVALP